MLGSLVALPVDFRGKLRSNTAPTSVSSTTKSSSGNVVARTTIALEYAAIGNQDHCPTGMYVVPSAESIMIWDGVLFVHQGYYADAILKFRIVFPSSYPQQPPGVQFSTDIFHPLIDQIGDFNLSAFFQRWRPDEHRVFHVLHWIKVAFKKHALDQFKESDCLNKEGFRYHESIQSFAALATQSATLSHSESALFHKDHPPKAQTSVNVLTFQKLKPKRLQEYRNRFGLRDWEETISSDT
ncbi:ubiquitin-conjugating enzyme/RWD-like protein [Cyathus striatus]|nr:ubiquitin-conjugating enzyme/RWD-like protein [Cyathus striatus]